MVGNSRYSPVNGTRSGSDSGRPATVVTECLGQIRAVAPRLTAGRRMTPGRRSFPASFTHAGGAVPVFDFAGRLGCCSPATGPGSKNEDCIATMATARNSVQRTAASVFQVLGRVRGRKARAPIARVTQIATAA